MKNEKLALQRWLEAAQAEKISLTAFLTTRAAAQLDQTEDQVLAEMTARLQVMEEAINFGLTGAPSHSGLTGGAAKKLAAALATQQKYRLLGELADDAAVFAIAVSECNAAMGRIVAAPTAGASGVLPGVFFALKKHCQLSDKDLAQGLVVAGSIGEVIANRASLAGATGGCQAECGSAAAMAAGAAVSMLGGNGEQVLAAVAMVFKNILGLVCDPVAGLVEVPCIKRNAACALQALLAAEMALAGITSFIPADEAIDAMKAVGDSLPCALRETAQGGLAATPTAKAWTKGYFGE